MHTLNSKSNHTFAYVLILKDDLSGFVALIPSSSPDHFVMADAFMDWYTRFGLPQYLVSDQRSHFTDQTLKEFNRFYRQIITSVSRNLQSTMTSLLSEFRMQSEEWPAAFQLSKVFWSTKIGSSRRICSFDDLYGIACFISSWSNIRFKKKRHQNDSIVKRSYHGPPERLNC